MSDNDFATRNVRDIKKLITEFLNDLMRIKDRIIDADDKLAIKPYREKWERKLKDG